MKKYLTYAIAAFVATTVVAIASPETDMVQSKEKAAWQAFKDKKADDFKNLVDKDFRGVYAEGISSLQKELDDMKKWDMKSFSISDFSAFSDEPDVVVTTYIVKIEGTYDGKDAPALTTRVPSGKRRRTLGWQFSTLIQSKRQQRSSREILERKTRVGSPRSIESRAEIEM